MTVTQTRTILLTLGIAMSQANPTAADAASVADTTPLELVIRIDDLGYCHAANLGLKRVLEEGVCTSVSVMVSSPWFNQCVEILKQHPNVSVGVHLTLNCEWREYRLGPVLHPTDVPSLVDEFGHFKGTRAALMAAEPKLDEVERELEAQIKRGLQSGLKISYVDYHMGAAVGAREFQQIVEKLARKYDLGISRYFSESYAANVYHPAPQDKLDCAIEIINNLPSTGRHLMVFHPGADTPEMAAMTDMNPGGVTEMSKHRQAETDVLCHPRFINAIKERGIKLVGYAELREQGLDRMTRPFEAPPYAEVVAQAKSDLAEQRPPRENQSMPSSYSH